MRSRSSFLGLVLWGLGTLSSPSAHGADIEGMYFGANVGAVSLANKGNRYANALGLGIEGAVRIREGFDLFFRSLWARHEGVPALVNWSQTFSLDYRVLDVNEMEVVIGAGPGVYLFSNQDNEFRVGLNLGGGVNLRIDDHTRLGAQFRYHAVAGPILGDRFVTVLMNIGYLFGN